MLQSESSTSCVIQWYFALKRVCTCTILLWSWMTVTLQESTSLTRHNTNSASNSLLQVFKLQKGLGQSCEMINLGQAHFKVYNPLKSFQVASLWQIAAGPSLLQSRGCIQRSEWERLLTNFNRCLCSNTFSHLTHSLTHRHIQTKLLARFASSFYPVKIFSTIIHCSPVFFSIFNSDSNVAILVIECSFILWQYHVPYLTVENSFFPLPSALSYQFHTPTH